MARIKIESNPYNQEIQYSFWSESEGGWQNLKDCYDVNSKLLSDALVKGFFTFHVKEIVDVILHDYWNEQEKVYIEFEGTDDEFTELVSICAEGDYPAKKEISRSDRRLANARDILPSITQIFSEHLSPLIMKSVDESKIDVELRKFSDASKDTIPICILGNYSAGKSTFINSLIGAEVLPSGDEPITAKIYQISRSATQDRASVELDYEEERFKILFKENDNEIIYTGGDKPLYNQIKEKLDALGAIRITDRVHEALEIINSFDRNDSPDVISNLITLQVPFSGGLLAHANRDFVIFDTPGSNSASNEKHLQVLKAQMHNLSNGLPIFLSEYDSLDSTDNDRLYKIIREVQELDSRFTMIIVNKADTARIPKAGFSQQDIEQILGMAVPRNLYTEGIYFVSSIVGLGAKNGEDFLDEHCGEIFEGEKNKYGDSSSKYYKTLYKNNIMPEQLKRRAMEKAEAREDLLYTNSGLFSVEDEIITFAEKYSHYNKCKQAYLFLDRVIGHTSEEIEKTKGEREIQRRSVSDAFEQDKKDLINRMESYAQQLEAQFKTEYPAHMQTCLRIVEQVYSEQQLEAIETEFINAQKQEKNFEDRQVDVLRAKVALNSNLKENIGKVFKEKSLGKSLTALKELSSDFIDDLSEVSKNKDTLSDTKHDVDKSASDELLQKIKNDFTNHINEAQRRIAYVSNKYWQNKSDEIRSQLVEIVTGSSVLTKEKKAEITDLILAYENLNLDNIAENTFIRDDFEKGIWIGKIKIVSSDRLNIKKLVAKYNAKMVEIVGSLFQVVSQTHENSLNAWIANLLDRIRMNIVELNTSLQEQANHIRDISNKIEELERRQIDLTNYTEQIRSMMDWSTI